ncbi:Crp/Fnr family transcriptional regulator [Listeria booriae]|uniref:Crp/Fnr family transcriptional regulator n=1 Tax=Listeria booriae TaxID=1552123 RepID=A0A7X0XES9_9LIST|nr:Crp/Fnr family transcriptional regulator [Listeria booriae]MBC1291362.1 Crp/Fnr family transcriptional regulator [Listeria booriae]MBC1335725.1 Crp/Fnr family transcriptional regulator [Listeria booriae]MBC1492895.1 Crp/Fnr family transcriptional regulator [Listeria booriae]MBC1504566.1 Crp/Fnr family transcriptional regulator [Listeria booriae]MBC1513388.1 Crp/Fnr family transcriptional regulator [Listeria booriae]
MKIVWKNRTFFGKQQLVFSEEDKAFLIKSGIVEVQTRAESVLAYLGAGDTIVVNEGLDFYARTALDLEEVELEENRYASFYNHLLVERMDEYHYSAQARVSICIKKLADKFGTEKNGEIQIATNFTQYDIANYCNLKREYISVLLRRLAGRRIIRIKPKPWVVLDMEALREYISETSF